MADEHDDLYAMVRTEFTPVRLSDDLDAVTARGRTLRRRHRTALTATLAAVTAAAAALALTLPAATPTPMNLAAWSVDAAPDGTVVLTIRQMTDAGRLTATLQAAGVPALVEFKTVPPDAAMVGCAENTQQSLPQLHDIMPIGPAGPRENERVFTIHRDRMPPGTSLHFVLFEEATPGATASRSVQTSLVTGTPLPCEPPWETGR